MHSEAHDELKLGDLVTWGSGFDQSILYKIIEERPTGKIVIERVPRSYQLVARKNSMRKATQIEIARILARLMIR